MGADPLSRCPHCGRTVVVPGHVRKTTLKDRNKMRERIERDAERQRRALVNTDFRPGQSPIIIGLMLLVMVVLGGMVVGRVNLQSQISSRGSVREMKAERNVHALRIAVERFKVDSGRYPTENEGLKALVLNPGITNWGGYYVNVVRPDPWNTPYIYSQVSNRVTVASAGPDRKAGTSDDIVAQEPTPEEVKRKH
jgi:general secretion pathway protein G